MSQILSDWNICSKQFTCCNRSKLAQRSVAVWRNHEVFCGWFGGPLGVGPTSRHDVYVLRAKKTRPQVGYIALRGAVLPKKSPPKNIRKKSAIIFGNCYIQACLGHLVIVNQVAFVISYSVKGESLTGALRQTRIGWATPVSSLEV
jgi:hypothetical protein